MALESSVGNCQAKAPNAQAIGIPASRATISHHPVGIQITDQQCFDAHSEDSDCKVQWLGGTLTHLGGRNFFMPRRHLGPLLLQFSLLVVLSEDIEWSCRWDLEQPDKSSTSYKATCTHLSAQCCHFDH